MLHFCDTDTYINTLLLALLLRKERYTKITRMLFGGGALAAQSGTSSAACSSSVSAASLKTMNLTNGRKTSHLNSSSSSSSSSSAWTKTRTSSVSSSSLSSSAMRMLSSRTRVSGNGAHFLAIERTKSSSVRNKNNKTRKLLVVKEIVCADPRRVARVQQQMRREIGNMFQNDAKIKGMLNPDVKFGVDVNSTTLATVADCEVSNDLQVVKVYVSVLGDERGKKNAMKGLQKLEGYVRGKIGSKISLRLTPEVRFVLDESFERGQKVNSILDVLREERERGSSSSSNATKEEMMAIEDTIAERGDDEEEWLEDDEDEVFEEDEQEVVIKPLRRKKN